VFGINPYSQRQCVSEHVC